MPHRPADAPHLPPAWHALDLTAVAGRLQTDTARGLPAAEAATRLARCGDNALDEAPPAAWWWKILGQFKALVIWILLAAAGIAAALGDWADTAAILAIVLVNVTIGFFQEERALRALAALERLAAPLAKVMRDGVLHAVPARSIVPGDRIELEAGDQVPADARLVEARGLRVQESALTGESVPVEKGPTGPMAEDAPLGDRRSMVHAGTVVAAGRGAALVVETGMQTQLGKIARLLERSPSETTPLQRRLDELGRVLVVICLVVVGIIVLLEAWRGGGLLALWRGGGLGEVMLRGVSLAVAAVPEGLPAVVTLVLAIGMQRMVARNALVRRLPSVETLGSVTVICSDKTGTLTRNEMTVREALTASGRYRITGAGYEPRGEFLREPEGMAVVAANPDLRRLLLIAARCGSATVEPTGDGGGWHVVGDSTEGALVVAALKGGVTAQDASAPVILEIPFDSERKRMSVVVRTETGSRLMLTKGATEEVLARCTAELHDGAVVPLADDRRRELLAVAAEMASRALRVLSLACRDLAAGDPLDVQPAVAERDLVHVGLVGMIDPPRDEARRAVERCRTAGIRPVMITGDHPATALAIGRELGLADGCDRGVTGIELDGMTDERLADEVASIAVYARVSAEHKLRVVQAWQRRGEIVAMTGDGVNDAPAVKAADIGIAMGISGTDVTKETSDMVLIDDNFASIVTAVEEGRGIYDNIQKFIHYLLSCNVGEVLTMFVAAAAGWPAPLAAIQILWLNLVTDGLPALALGLEPPERDIMERPPRPPQEPVITPTRGMLILAHGAIVAAVVLGTYWMTWRGDDARLERARSATFCVAAFAQLFFAIGCRSDRVTAFAVGFTRNPALLLAIMLSSLLQVVVVTLPPARSVFEVGHAVSGDWPLVIALAVVPVTVIELAKGCGRRRPPVTSSGGP